MLTLLIILGSLVAYLTTGVLYSRSQIPALAATTFYNWNEYHNEWAEKNTDGQRSARKSWAVGYVFIWPGAAISRSLDNALDKHDPKIAEKKQHDLEISLKAAQLKNTELEHGMGLCPESVKDCLDPKGHRKMLTAGYKTESLDAVSAL
jgi:hypothetical protein